MKESKVSRETLYSQYQTLYRKYQEDKARTEELNQDIGLWGRRKKRDREELQEKKTQVLRSISEKKERYKQQLAAVRKDGANSSVVREYSASRLKQIRGCQEEQKKLEEQRAEKVKALQQQKKQKLSALESEKKTCQSRLNELMGGQAGSQYAKFDENQLRQTLLREKTAQVAEATRVLDEEIEECEKKLMNVDARYEVIHKNELAKVTGKHELYSTYKNLKEKKDANELPQVISDALAEPIESAVQRLRIREGQDVARLAGHAESLDNLLNYTPSWLYDVVMFGIPLALGLVLLLVFLIGGIHFGFVATAANTIVNILIWAVFTLLGFGIVFGILCAIAGPVVGAIGGLVGGVIGFILSQDHVITLSYGVTNVLEWIIKILLCAAVVGLSFLLLSITSLDIVLINLFMKLSFMKKIALTNQGEKIRENIDSYYVLMNYREIIPYVVEERKKNEVEELTADVERRKAARESEIAAVIAKIDADNDRKLAREKASAESNRKKQEQEQKDLFRRQDECMLRMSECDAGIKKTTDEYDEKISETKRRYEQSLAEVQKKLKQLNSQVSGDAETLITRLTSDIAGADAEYGRTETDFDRQMQEIDQTCENKTRQAREDMAQLKDDMEDCLEKLDELYKQILRPPFADIQSTEGIVSDVVYVADHNNVEKSFKEDRTPLELFPIRHRKRPVVFLYEEPSGEFAQRLYDFMDFVMIGFRTINCAMLCEMYITDHVTDALQFSQQAGVGHVRIVNDIREIGDIVTEGMRAVARKGQLSIDEWNRRLVQEGGDEEDIGQFCKYQIVQFVAPKGGKEFFNSELWTKFETSQKYGFLPIIYVSRAEWENTLNPNEKFKSAFVEKLNAALGEDRSNVYVADLQNVTIRQYK